MFALQLRDWVLILLQLNLHWSRSVQFGTRVILGLAVLQYVPIFLLFSTLWANLDLQVPFVWSFKLDLLQYTFSFLRDPHIIFLLKADTLVLSQFQDSEFRKSTNDLKDEDIIDTLAMPPYRPGESFHKTYDVILILDERENFGFAI